MEIDSYSGNYHDLVEEQNYMGSFDVKSFPMQTRFVSVFLQESGTTMIYHIICYVLLVHIHVDHPRIHRTYLPLQRLEWFL